MRTAIPKEAALQWLVHGHFWLALAVAAQTAWTALFLSPGTPIWGYVAAASLGVFTAYGLMRLARSKPGSERAGGTLGWFRLHRGRMGFLMAWAAVGAAWLLGGYPRSIWNMLLPAMALAFLYATPFDAAPGRAVGLRAVPFLKVLLIAAAWSVVTVAVPWRLDGQPRSDWYILSMACMRMPLYMGLAILFDIRDLGQDAPGLRTLPIVLGVKGAKAVSVLLLASSALFESIYLHGLGQFLAIRTILVGYAVAMVVVWRARPGQAGPVFDLWVDGMMILVPLCGWLGMNR
jgi:hypothetical protein